MIRIIVDSGSSIKQNEKTNYPIEIVPLKVLFNEDEYLDGVDLTNDEFYKKLVDEKIFPKTSLPNLDDIENKVKEIVSSGDEVLFITISSGISGTHDAIAMRLSELKGVYVFDSLSAVGGIRLLVIEALKHLNEPLQKVVSILEELRSRIVIMAIPETLDYLYRGGRLSQYDRLIGNLLGIKPVIGFKDGKVKVLAKKRGLKNGMRYIVENMDDVDTSYPIIASYTYNKKNLESLKTMTSSSLMPYVNVEDDLDPAIACHWGPNAFGYVFISKAKK